MIVYVSVALSMDGCLDDLKAQRLRLSGAEDLEAVQHLRAGFDALMVGAETVRRDNPSLGLKSERWQQMRRARGEAAEPMKVTLSASGNLSPQSRFFTTGTGRKVVLLGASASAQAATRLQGVAEVIRLPEPITLDAIRTALQSLGVRTLFVEGGSRLLTLWLTGNGVDLLRVAHAPFWVGDPSAPHFVGRGRFPFDGSRRMELLRTTQVGDMAVAEYSLTPQGHDYDRLCQAIALAACAPLSETAYGVGAVIETRSGACFTGYSRESGVQNHAEEEAILKAEEAGVNLEGAVLYSSMEPCSIRKSKPLSCSALILNRRMRKVVFAAYEPDHFVQCCGAQCLREGGVEVVVIEALSTQALACNAHVLP